MEWEETIRQAKVKSGLSHYEAAQDEASAALQALRRQITITVARTPAGVLAKLATVSSSFSDDQWDDSQNKKP